MRRPEGREDSTIIPEAMFLKFLFRKNEVRPSSKKMASKQFSSQTRLSRSGRGIGRYERIRKHEEEEELCSEKEICLEAEVTRKKMRRLFKLGRRGPKIRRSKSKRISTSEMGRGFSGATLFSQLKVSWRRFTKMVKDRGPHFTELLTESRGLLHLQPSLPAYWYDKRGGVKDRQINGLP